MDGPITRRNALRTSAAAAVAALAGCQSPTEQTTETTTQQTTTTTKEFSPGGTWPMYLYNPENTAFAPGVSGPAASGTAWSADLGGEDVATPPVVVSNTVYALGAHDDQGKHRVVALDAKSGKQQWEATIAGGDVTGGFSVGVLAGLLYVATDTTVSAVSLSDGSVPWTHSVSEGGLGTPIAGDNAVYVPYGTDAGHVVALSLSEGKPLWTADLGAVPTTPVSVGQGVAYVGTESGVTALATGSGKEQWSVSLDDAAAGHVTVQANTLYATDASGVVYSLATADGGEQWRFEQGTGVSRSGPALADGTLFVADENGVRAISAADGKQQWSNEITANALSPVVAGDTVYVAADTSLVAVDRASGEKDWSATPGDAAVNLPAVVEGAAFVTTNAGSVYAIGK